MHQILAISKRNIFLTCLFFLFLFSAQLITVVLSENINNNYYYLVIFFSYIFFITLLKWPENALYLAAIVSPLQSFIISSKKIAEFGGMVVLWFLDVVAFICLIALFIKFITEKDENLYISRSYHLPIFILCSYSLLSFLWMKNTQVGIYTFIKLVSCVLLFYAPIVLVGEKEHLIRIIGLFFISGIIAAAGGIISITMKQGLSTSDFIYFKEKITEYLDIIMLFYPSIKLRAQGFAYSNFLSFSLSVSFICGLYLLTRIGWVLKKVLILLMLCGILYTQIHTLSKGGLLAFAIGALFFIFSNAETKKKWPRYMVIFFIAFLIIFFIFSTYKFEGGAGRLGTGIISERMQSSWGTRIYLWEKGIEHFLDYYGIGTGIGGLIPLTHLHLHAHNAYLGALFELGLIGFFMYLMLYYIFISQAKRFKMLASDEFNPLFTTFTSILIVWSLQSLIEFDYYLLRIPWFIFGLAVATIKLKLIHDRRLIK